MQKIRIPAIIAALLLLVGAGCATTPPVQPLPTAPPAEKPAATHAATTSKEALPQTLPPTQKPVSLEPYYIAYTADGAARAAAQGRPIVYYFWASWCPICHEEEPKVKARIEHSNLPIAGFRVDFDTETALKEKYKIPYQHTTVFLDKKGEEVARLFGPSTDAEFDAALALASK